MRRTALSILAAALIARGAAAAAPPSTNPAAAAAYERGQARAAAGNPAEAADALEEAVRAEPTFTLAWFALAAQSRRAGRCDRAVAAYRRYMVLRPGDAEPHYGEALCLEALGDKAAAAAAFRKYVAMEQRPEARRFVEQARARLAALEPAPAAPAPPAVSQAAPRPPAAPLSAPAPVAVATAPAAGGARALLDEARALRDQRRAVEATARYRAAIASGAGADARFELGELLVAGRRYGEAVDELRVATELAPQHPVAWYDLGFALRRTGRAAEAVEAYRRYIVLRPADPDPHYGLGRALVAAGRDDEALSAFRTYASLETRPSERAWVDRARAEAARIEGARRRPSGAGQPLQPPPFTPGGAGSTPPTEPPPTRQP